MVVGTVQKLFSWSRNALSGKHTIVRLAFIPSLFLATLGVYGQDIAIVTFNNYYQSTSSSFTSGSNTIAVSTPYVNQKIFFRAANSATSFTCVSSNISGDLYLNGTWIPGKIYAKGPSGGATHYFAFIPNSTPTRIYVLIKPGSESSTVSELNASNELKFSSNCPDAELNSFRNSQPSLGAPLPALQTICTNTTPGTITVSNATGGSTPYSYAWYENTTGSNLPTLNQLPISGQTTTTLQPPTKNTSGTFYYFCEVTDNNGSKSYSSVSSIVVSESVSGSITGAASVCSETNSTTLTLSGYTGNIQWQSSTDNNTFLNIVGATNTTFVATNLTSTTYYRAVVTNGLYICFKFICRYYCKFSFYNKLYKW
jgi:hypothetical protein